MREWIHYSSPFFFSSGGRATQRHVIGPLTLLISSGGIC